MKRTSIRPGLREGFTLVELLVVISIIAILAAMALSALSSAKTKTQVAMARTEMGKIGMAIQEYETAYSRFPVSSNAIGSSTATGDDFTFGGVFRKPDGNPYSVEASGSYKTNNAEVMAILMDMENYRNGQPTINKDHVKNPKQTAFLNAREVSDTSSPGVGLDGVYRDFWRNPYIITMDLNSDNKCRDAFYRLDSVSSMSGQTGFNGLFNSSGVADRFEFSGSVMVWSVGPDKTLDPTQKSTASVNKDNVLNWKQ